MWKRWGYHTLGEFSSLVTEVPWVVASRAHEVEIERSRRLVVAATVAAYSGMVHGAKAVTATQANGLLNRIRDELPDEIEKKIPTVKGTLGTIIRGAIDQIVPTKAPSGWSFLDDPLCGPRYSFPWRREGAPASSLVQWKSVGGTFPGVGDHFWDPPETTHLASLKRDQVYGEQRARLLSCTGSSIREVYERGPQAHGALKPAVMDDGAQIVDPRSEYCWGQWATNESMLGALGPAYLTRAWDVSDTIFGPGGFDLLVNKIVATDRAKKLLWYMSDDDQDKLPFIDYLGSRLALDSAKVRLAFAANATYDPEGTDSARLLGPAGKEITVLDAAPSRPRRSTSIPILRARE